MPFIKLSDGTEAKIGVHHVDDMTLPGFGNTKFRGTRVRLTLPDGYEILGRSVCKPPDQFSRRTGRIMAARHLMEATDRWLSKVDRAIIFKAICPECAVGHKLDGKPRQ